MRRWNRICWLGLMALALTISATSAHEVPAGTQSRPQVLTYGDLLDHLTNVQRLAVLPEPGSSTSQASSYDRRSKVQNGVYIDWSANDDGSGAISTDAKTGNTVLAEMQGPGVIWRIWSAQPMNGHVKVYIDGSDTPVIDLPFIRYFDGTQSPFNLPSLVYQTAARGYNNYVPIAFQKSLKIVAEPGWGKYFQFEWEKLPAQTIVPTFTMKLSPKESAALHQVDHTLGEMLGQEPVQYKKNKTEAIDVKVAAEQTKTVLKLSGEGAITGIRVRMKFLNRADQIAALRELAIRIRWDGASTAAVWSPLGDFFGTAMGVNHYRTLLTGMTDDGFYAYWYMPFAKGAVIELSNDGPIDRDVHFEISHAPLDRPVEQLGRFHARWHRGALHPDGSRWPDWSVLRTKGRGRFVGMMLHVWNPNGGKDLVDAPGAYWWWGEGDEKFFVDGESFPSIFGTGTEDYFGYAWSNPSLFSHAFHAQTLTQANNGHQSLVRWQVAENVPFQKSFDGYLEKYYPDSFPTRYGVLVCWYVDHAGEPDYTEASLEQRTGYYHRTDATEGENLEVENVTGGTTQVQHLATSDVGESIWSGARQLWWFDGAVGDSMKVAVPVAHDGVYQVFATLTHAPDYGIAQITFADKTLAPIDFFSKELGVWNFYLGTYSLKRGSTNMTFRITGQDKRAEPRRMVGLDYVNFIPVSD